MASPSDSISMALFCDFENVALGVRDAQYEKFDIKPILERLLLKGSIVVKKAYCDWERYKGFKATMHEANFELIEIPHVRQSGKNSADIRLVVDALDLCYTKSHVDTFVIISGDSDFSPLVSKLRENNKIVIGVGVKESTSDLLISNCDEFIYYEDIVRKAARRKPKKQAQQKKDNGEGNGNGNGKRSEERDRDRAQKAFDIVLETLDDITSERGEESKSGGPWSNRPSSAGSLRSVRATTASGPLDCSWKRWASGICSPWSTTTSRAATSSRITRATEPALEKRLLAFFDPHKKKRPGIRGSFQIVWCRQFVSTTLP